MAYPASVSIPAPRRPGDVVGILESGSLGPSEPPAGALTLLVHARACLRDAESAADPRDRFVSAYVAAVRAANAVLVARGPRRSRVRPTSVWVLLADIAPELAEWAHLLARYSDRRSAVEAGSLRLTDREAIEAVDQVAVFVGTVGRGLTGATT